MQVIVCITKDVGRDSVAADVKLDISSKLFDSMFSSFQMKTR